MDIGLKQKETIKKMRNIQFFSQLIHSYEIQVSLVYEDIFKLFKKKLKNERDWKEGLLFFIS
ncbi:hypothetical protein CMV37_17110 [Bacillus cereus]|nr:hypothetical protein CMV37_17110 [Bacillus cereus]